MINGELRIEYEDVLMATEGHAIRVEETDWGRLIPDEIVAKPIAARVDEVGRERLRRGQDDGPARGEQSAVLPEKNVERKPLVPRAVRDAIRKVAEDEVDAPLREERHEAKTISENDAIEIRCNAAVHELNLACVRPVGFKSWQGWKRARRRVRTRLDGKSQGVTPSDRILMAF
jgi:hypothetical protein